MSKSLADLGERKVIDVIRNQYSYFWPDDDASIIDSGKEYTLITTDAISQGSHIPKGASWEAVGYFFAALNLSDIAAMGGKPKYFMAAMTFPRNTKIEEVAQIERGINRCLQRYGVKLIGGDLKEGQELNMAGVAIGTASKKNVLRRSGSKPGDLVCISGNLGRNGAAYHMWKRDGSKKWANLLLKIEPMVKEGLLISKLGASSAMDLSDGLFSSVLQLARISGHGFEIDYEKLPVDKFAIEVSRKFKVPIEEIACNFGGEYELLFTISKRNFAALQKAAMRSGIKISAIGRVSGTGAVMSKNGIKTKIAKKGYEHFLGSK